MSDVTFRQPASLSHSASLQNLHISSPGSKENCRQPSQSNTRFAAFLWNQRVFAGDVLGVGDRNLSGKFLLRALSATRQRQDLLPISTQPPSNLTAQQIVNFPTIREIREDGGSSPRTVRGPETRSHHRRMAGSRRGCSRRSRVDGGPLVRCGGASLCSLQSGYPRSNIAGRLRAISSCFNCTPPLSSCQPSRTSDMPPQVQRRSNPTTCHWELRSHFLRQCGALRMGAAGSDVPKLLESVDLADTTTEKMVCTGASSQAPGAAEESGRTFVAGLAWTVPRTLGAARTRGSGDHSDPGFPVGLGWCAGGHSAAIRDGSGLDVACRAWSHCNEEAGQRKELQTCDRLTQRICALNLRWRYLSLFSLTLVPRVSSQARGPTWMPWCVPSWKVTFQ